MAIKLAGIFGSILLTTGVAAAQQHDPKFSPYICIGVETSGEKVGLQVGDEIIVGLTWNSGITIVLEGGGSFKYDECSASGDLNVCVGNAGQHRVVFDVKDLTYTRTFSWGPFEKFQCRRLPLKRVQVE